MQHGQRKVAEVATALIKISVYVRRAELRRRIEGLAFRLVEEMSCASHEEVGKTLDAIENFMHLGRHLYEVEPMNAEVILREIGYLRSVADDHAQSIVRGTPPVGDIEAIFSHPDETLPDTDAQKHSKDHEPPKKRTRQKGAAEPVNNLLDDVANAAMDGEGDATRQDNPAMEDKPAKNAATEPGNGNGEDDQAIRQSDIFEKMRQLSDQKMQLKDIIATFPGVSERTIRYDLKRLCSQGLLERIGPGGPGTYYKVRVV